MGSANPEYQKPFSYVGHLNAEIITRKSYCGKANPTLRVCICDHCEDERDKLKRKVNQLMKRRFYTNVPGEKNEQV